MNSEMRHEGEQERGEYRFDHERLDVYRLILEYLAFLVEQEKAFPAGESAAGWDLLRVRGYSPAPACERAKAMLGRIAAMLSGLGA